MNRRSFLEKLAGTGGALLLSPLSSACQTKVPAPLGAKTRIAFVKTTDRAAGVKKAIGLLNSDGFRDKSLFIKPNYNSADITPGSTHADTLVALIEELRKAGAKEFTVGDRSGMGKTREVMEATEAFRIAKDLRTKTLVFDELADSDWELFKSDSMKWPRGFLLPKPVLRADAIVQTCCLKTHRFGGHFTLSLKNSVGFAARRIQGDPYDFMRELHSSSDQRRMIAEINTAYKPALVVLDGVEAFTTGGPDKGNVAKSEVIIAGTDRVAIDAVGVAILRHFGTTPEVSKGRIFEQEQIARAVELGLGIASPEQIEFVTPDDASKEYAALISKQFA
ncbi:MAG: DUF362 domain-containing protein [Acidobacteria bacterium]|nr:DUF362 domain-containing protein [Acidobacteriota bacterium]